MNRQDAKSAKVLNFAMHIRPSAATILRIQARNVKPKILLAFLAAAWRLGGYSAPQFAMIPRLMLSDPRD